MTTCETRYAVHPTDFMRYTTERIRNEFLVDAMFLPNQVRLVYVHYDRLVVGGAMPMAEPLELESPEQLRAAYFLERRELGMVNVGGPGRVVADGQIYEMGYKDALYLGRGVRRVLFESADAQNPARFYLNSAPAHTAYPNRWVPLHQARVLNLGAQQTSNERQINQLIISGLVDTCQLQMGMTELRPGSVWNTMPAHTHDRRMEAYFYFEVPANQTICHFMGQPTETRHLFLHNEQAVVSPPWSIHSAAGTSNYVFIWGMAGENLDYSDMDHAQPTQLR